MDKNYQGYLAAQFSTLPGPSDPPARLLGDIATELDMDFFLDTLSQLHGERCQSLRLHDALRKEAVKKNGKKKDETNENLLFPPSIINRTLVEKEIRSILTCRCLICASVKGRELLADDILVDAVTAEDGYEQRKLFGLLVFMGAGFAARHICSFPPRGWDITSRESSIQSQLFEPLHASSSIFPSPEIVTRIFTSVFKQTWLIFDAPKMQIGSVITNLDGVNLPFINEAPLKGDKGAFGSLYSFEIHAEFRGQGVPAHAVRKELPDIDSTLEERRILEFLAESGRPNFVQFLFWYRSGDKINYVFPLYPGSLQQAMEGRLNLPISPTRPSKYAAILQHWLWQGIIDVVGALKVFHFPDEKILRQQLIAAHFDLKPANILVNSDGVLLLTDFGQARMKAFNPLGGSTLTAQTGDANYQPPPISLSQNTVSTSTGLAISQTKDISLRWNRAYDVWSMACIMTEVIEFIMQGPVGFQSFRQRRINEDHHQPSAAFWKRSTIEGKYELKTSVQETLSRFRRTQDRYLIMVTDMIESMFYINPLQRPPIADCLSIISEDIPTDEWPLKDEDEVSICGLGTNPQLRNIRLRVVAEFEKEIIDGENKSKISCVLSDSARREEEEFQLSSLFKPKHRPIVSMSHECSFRIVHPNLSFVFDGPQRGPQAMTRQRSLLPQVYMPISKCTIKPATLFGDKEYYSEGHVQIWKELTEDEFLRDFTYIPPERPRQKPEGLEINPTFSGPRSPTQDSIISHQSRTISVSSGSSGPADRSQTPNEVKTRRLVVFLSGAGRPSSSAMLPRLLTINRKSYSGLHLQIPFQFSNPAVAVTNGYNAAQVRRTCKGYTSNCCITFKAVGGNFFVGNFTSEKGNPGIPLDPDVFAQREKHHVDWVELEFKDPAAMQGFMNLWDKLFPP
ncbi:kinase-like protein [Stipitochalara longipes BDJ]|nr:kinase-like protein [Stipitochalara longipes BDJ]